MEQTLFALEISDERPFAAAESNKNNWGEQQQASDIHSYAREVENGNVEYKLKLCNPSAARFEQLVTQLKYRLEEGNGEAIYEIGVEDGGVLRGLSDDEMAKSLATLQKMCDQLEANMLVRHRRRVAESARTVAEVVVRMLAEQRKREVRVAFVGGGQSGKSTLLAALATGQLDNGQGSARMLVMRHMHEIESGATSSISQQVIGFDADGALLNSADATFGTSSAADVVESAETIVTLLDLCGQARYLKTTLYGLTAHAPDVALLTVRADDARGAVASARLHASLAAALRLPLVVVVTCADASAESSVRQVLDELCALLSGEGFPAPTVCASAAELAWAPVSVLSIKYKELAVTCAEAGQSASFSLQVHDGKTKLRRGMVLREAGSTPGEVVWELEATLRAIQLPNGAVPLGTEVVLHCGGVKQAARLLAVEGGESRFAPRRSDDGKAIPSRLRLRFVHCAEFLRVGAPCVFRDASAGADQLSLGVGWVSQLIAD